MSQRRFFADNLPSLVEYLREGVIIPGHCCVYDTVECLIEPYGFFYSYCSCLSRQSGPVLELVQCESFSNKPQDKLTTKVVDLEKCL